MSNENDYDLYGDLDDVLTESTSQKEISKSDEVRKESTKNENYLSEVLEKMKILQEDLNQALRKKEIIESNMSVLLLTCKNEIER